jgi:hypothetical protein
MLGHDRLQYQRLQNVFNIELPELNKNRGHPVQFEFQIHNSFQHKQVPNVTQACELVMYLKFNLTVFSRQSILEQSKRHGKGMSWVPQSRLGKFPPSWAKRQGSGFGI